MVCIAIYIEGDDDYAVELRNALVERDPSFRVVDWKTALEEGDKVDYALVWMPPIGDLARLTGLKAILSVSAGVDHIIVRDPDWPRHVKLIRMGAGETAELMGDYLLWACLSLIRGARDWALQQSRHEWTRKIVTRPMSDCTVGLMGLGNLGRAVAMQLARAGLQVRGWSTSPKEINDVETFSGDDALPAFLTGTDILICLLPKTAATRHIINGDVLRKLRHGAGFINVGRGEHVVEGDLLAALDDGALSGAVLDVFEEESLATSSAFWTHPSVIVTPHIASQASTGARVNYLWEVIHLIEGGGRPALSFDPEKGY